MLSFGYRLYDSLCNFVLIILIHLIMHLKTETYISIIYRVLYVSAEDHRAGRDDVSTGKLFPSRGECLGLYPCVLIIFKRK